MIDYSFLRLKNNFDDAKDLAESPAIDIFYAGQVHLVPNETYLQTTSSETDIVVGSNFQVFFVDQCGNDVREVTDNVFINAFQDARGIWQFSWEFINTFEHYEQLLYFKFINQDNNDTWWSNGFITTENNRRFTARYDYKSIGERYGVDYSRADFHQSIRLSTYFNDDINESTREKYYQIGQSLEVSGRNNENFKEEYIAHNFNKFALKRLELMLTNDFVYIDNVRTYSNDPIEFEPREGDSNWIENPFIVSKDTNDRFTFQFQIFDGLQPVSFAPVGLHLPGTTFTRLEVIWNTNVELQTGTVSVYEGATLIDSFDEDVMSIFQNNRLRIDIAGSVLMNPANGDYHVNVTGGLVSALTDVNDAITDDTTWTFSLRQADFDGNDFNNQDFFTD